MSSKNLKVFIVWCTAHCPDEVAVKEHGNQFFVTVHDRELVDPPSLHLEGTFADLGSAIRSDDKILPEI